MSTTAIFIVSLSLLLMSLTLAMPKLSNNDIYAYLNNDYDKLWRSLDDGAGLQAATKRNVPDPLPSILRFGRSVQSNNAHFGFGKSSRTKVAMLSKPTDYLDNDYAVNWQ
jgi:hypothetical protein